MFGIGAPELLIILFLALIIVGPQRLPELGRTLGQAIGQFKAQTDELRSVMSFDTPSSTSNLRATSHFPATGTGAEAYGSAAESFLANTQALKAQAATEMLPDEVDEVRYVPQTVPPAEIDLRK